jgi:YVTN family beta-propeller protein
LTKNDTMKRKRSSTAGSTTEGEVKTLYIKIFTSKTGDGRSDDLHNRKAQYIGACAIVTLLVSIVVWLVVFQPVYVCVANLGSETVSVIDTAKNEVIATIPLAMKNYWCRPAIVLNRTEELELSLL